MLREQLDEIDSQIVDLFQKRMDICVKVGEYKLSVGKQVLDRTREQEKIRSVTEGVTDELYKKGVAELFEQIMSTSRAVQQRLIDNSSSEVEK